MVPVSLFT